MKCDHCKDEDLETKAYKKYPCYFCNDTGIKKIIVKERFISPAREKFRARVKELQEKLNRGLVNE